MTHATEKFASVCILVCSTVWVLVCRYVKENAPVNVYHRKKKRVGQQLNEKDFPNGKGKTYWKEKQSDWTVQHEHQMLA